MTAPATPLGHADAERVREGVASPHRWAHRRITLPARAAQRRLEADGFVAVGTSFPFRYFKRELDAPAAAG